MPITNRINGDNAELLLSGKLTYVESSDFRKNLMSVIEKKIKSLNIVLSDLNYMDSSGLGMLMVSLKECQTHNISLTITNPRDSVKSLLEMTNSYERFKISN